MKTVVYPAPTEIKTQLVNAFFMLVKTFANPPPEPLKGCDIPWSEMSTRAVIQSEDILTICCETWLDRL
jgi:hypothetical protein